MKLPSAALFGCLLALGGAPLSALPKVQEPAPSGTPAPTADRAQLERWLDAARNGSPVVRPQAAERLRRAGAPAAELLRPLAGETPAELAALGADLVEVLGRFGDPELRGRLWTAVAEPDFPWRPAAVRSLVHEPEAGEEPRFLTLAADPLAAVRVALVTVLPGDGSGNPGDALSPLLHDEDDRVRRAAAAELARRGATHPLLWLLEDLGRTDRWFEIDTGRRARFDAARLWRGLGRDLGSYDPAREPGEPGNQSALFELRAAVTREFQREPPALPDFARAGGDAPPGVIGLELRSCRRGELYLQWGPADVLFVGQGRPREVALAPGTVERLSQTATSSLAALGEQRVFGQPGCDAEVTRLDLDGAELQTLSLLKGAQPVPGLRPAPLEELVAQLLASVPAAESELAQRLRDGLEAVGGPARASQSE
jgi:hypothetical protein